ncbi:hypothetical protein PV325_009948 [Microctonus aethiopoides]|nr:hypothetical protein PV325_009948 [Microctonus aethiopoides]
MQSSLTSSLTSFLIGPLSFQSQTRNIATENMNNGTILRPSEETITLILQSIQPADSELEPIKNPGLTTITANAPVNLI